MSSKRVQEEQPQEVVAPYAAPRGFTRHEEELEHIRPEFEVHPLEGERKRTVLRYVTRKDENTGMKIQRLESKELTEPAGFMVFFARGHSIRVRDEAELARLKLNRRPGVVDLRTLERVGSGVMPTLQELSEAKGMAKSSQVNVVSIPATSE